MASMDLDQVLTIVFLVALFGAAASGIGAAAEFVARFVTNRMLFGFIKELHLSPIEIVYAAVYLPIFAAFSATVSGAGINLMTAKDRGLIDQLFGLTIVVGAFVILAYLGLQAARNFDKTRGLRRMRHLLRKIATLDVVDSSATWPRRIDILRRVGQRLDRGAARISFRAWVAKDTGGMQIFLFFLTCQALSLTFAALVSYALLQDTYDDKQADAGLIVLSGATLSAILFILGNLGSWRQYRHLYAGISAELARDADQALRVLREHRSEDAIATRDLGERSTTPPSVPAEGGSASISSRLAAGLARKPEYALVLLAMGALVGAFASSRWARSRPLS
jgi:hypothetical protein